MKKYKLEIYMQDEATKEIIMRLIRLWADSHGKDFYVLPGEFGIVEVEHTHTQID